MSVFLIIIIICSFLGVSLCVQLLKGLIFFALGLVGIPQSVNSMYSESRQLNYQHHCSSTAVVPTTAPTTATAILDGLAGSKITDV